MSVILKYKWILNIYYINLGWNNEFVYGIYWESFN